MRNTEEILARFHSEEVEDMFDAQKTALLCMLPYEVAKPHLDPVYVEKHEKNELPEEERWKEGWDIKNQILDYLPQVYRDLKNKDGFNIAVDFCYLRSWIWVQDPEFFDIVEPMFKNGGPDDAIKIIDFISDFYGYEEPISDISFEEISKENIDSESES